MEMYFPTETSLDSGSDVLNEFDLSLFDESFEDLQDTFTHSSGDFHSTEVYGGGSNTPLSLKECGWLATTQCWSSLDSPLAEDYTAASQCSHPQGFAHEPSAMEVGGERLTSDALPQVETRGLGVPGGGRQRAYEWPPQSDPELEKKRQRALKAFRNRQKASEREQAMKKQLEAMRSYIAQLHSQKQALERRLRIAEQQLAALTPQTTF